MLKLVVFLIGTTIPTTPPLTGQYLFQKIKDYKPVPKTAFSFRGTVPIVPVLDYETMIKYIFEINGKPTKKDFYDDSTLVRYLEVNQKAVLLVNRVHRMFQTDEDIYVYAKRVYKGVCIKYNMTELEVSFVALMNKQTIIKNKYIFGVEASPIEYTPYTPLFEARYFDYSGGYEEMPFVFNCYNGYEHDEYNGEMLDPYKILIFPEHLKINKTYADGSVDIKIEIDVQKYSVDMLKRTESLATWAVNIFEQKYKKIVRKVISKNNDVIQEFIAGHKLGNVLVFSPLSFKRGLIPQLINVSKDKKEQPFLRNYNKFYISSTEFITSDSYEKVQINHSEGVFYYIRLPSKVDRYKHRCSIWALNTERLINNDKILFVVDYNNKFLHFVQDADPKKLLFFTDSHSQIGINTLGYNKVPNFDVYNGRKYSNDSSSLPYLLASNKLCHERDLTITEYDSYYLGKNCLKAKADCDVQWQERFSFGSWAVDIAERKHKGKRTCLVSSKNYEYLWPYEVEIKGRDTTKELQYEYEGGTLPRILEREEPRYNMLLTDFHKYDFHFNESDIKVNPIFSGSDYKYLVITKNVPEKYEVMAGVYAVNKAEIEMDERKIIKVMSHDRNIMTVPYSHRFRHPLIFIDDLKHLTTMDEFHLISVITNSTKGIKSQNYIVKDSSELMIYSYYLNIYTEEDSPYINKFPVKELYNKPKRANGYNVHIYLAHRDILNKYAKKVKVDLTDVIEKALKTKLFGFSCSIEARNTLEVMSHDPKSPGPKPNSGHFPDEL